MTEVLYNPLADSRNGERNARKLGELLKRPDIRYLDITSLDIAEHLRQAAPEDTIIISGGDGTLNRFINQCGALPPEHPVYYYPAGSGNDFMNDVKDAADGPLVLLNPYLESLPVVTVNGKRYRFLNGVGYGIDGYCCEVGDDLREKGTASINYTSIAIKGLLFHFKPRRAVVTVDGVVHAFKNVWLAPAMNGRFYGGGMMVAPEQDRLGAAGTVSVVVLHCKRKLKTLMVFPSIFKGTHVRHTEMVQVLTGHRVEVSFDRPTALQIDGETIKGVTAYSVTAEARAVSVRGAAEEDKESASVC